MYSDRHADMRRALKTLADASQRWLGMLSALAGEAPFDLSRKEAIEAGQDIQTRLNACSANKPNISLCTRMKKARSEPSLNPMRESD